MILIKGDTVIIVKDVVGSHMSGVGSCFVSQHFRVPRSPTQLLSNTPRNMLLKSFQDKDGNFKFCKNWRGCFVKL